VTFAASEVPVAAVEAHTEVRFHSRQRAAIEVAGPPLDTCVVAGLAPARTTVLVEHFPPTGGGRRKPQRILAITFTEKAAATYAPKAGRGLSEIAPTRTGLGSRVVCAPLLKENGVFAAVDPNSRWPIPKRFRRLQQESIAARVEEPFRGTDRPRCAGPLSSRRFSRAFDFEEALFRLTMPCARPANGWKTLAGFAQPAGTGMADFAATAAALAADAATTWSFAQKQHLGEIRESAGAHRSRGPVRSKPCARWPAFPANLRKSK